MKVIKYIIIVFGILFFIAHQFDKKIQKASDSNNNSAGENSNTTQASESMANDGYVYTGNICAVCGNSCKKGKEVRSSGDAVSNYEPYYICGENMDCVYEREKQNKELKNSNQSDYNALDSRPKNDYEMGSDGRVYDTNPCSLCEGDGIEGFGDNTRICPMCDGKGRQSY